MAHFSVRCNPASPYSTTANPDTLGAVQSGDYEWTAIKPMLPNKPRGVFLGVTVNFHPQTHA
jgi:hypothetical protein